MSKNNQLNLVSILIAIIGLLMIYLGYSLNIWPPALTGIGFLLLSWGLQLFKN